MALRVVTPPRRHGRSDGSATGGCDHRCVRGDNRATRDRHGTSVRHRITEPGLGAQVVEPIPRCGDVSTIGPCGAKARRSNDQLRCRTVGQLAEHPPDRSGRGDSGTCLQHPAFGEPMPRRPRRCPLSKVPSGHCDEISFRFAG